MRDFDNSGQTQDRVNYNIRQVLKGKAHLGTLTLQPGQKLYEMVCVSNAGTSIPGLNAVTGDFDPELAIVREAASEKPVAVAGTPVVAGLGRGIGKVKPGLKRKFIVQDGNLYEVAINEVNARRKIIKKFFEPFK